MLHLLVAYDVNTVSENGSKRLYNLSKVCVQNGQRVQYSLFECQITETQFERFR
ncbi:MAG: CRISPR-associated endonuclease Cas2, partial [Caldisericales bacterium]|nr:CRISPR-associated endonuclease Cas2 [Caldisericales bacterium]